MLPLHRVHSLTDLELASADRRPVDPPPVVELRVFSNDVDVTMSYDSTFMLYASLEVARPIANGKMHTPTNIPVLTGVAVASAAYLDRPRPAAYFIFPDLSVRHEGWYRLKFSLFEGVKHEADADFGKPFTHAPQVNTNPLQPPIRHESMANRLEVQSTPFQVFSAKKFPGLQMSTALSKLVAEQGCRVRIRRDIRQRKRNAKGVHRDAEGDDISSYAGTPVATYRTLEHSRSVSRNSNSIGSHYDDAEHARRLSMESMPILATARTQNLSIASMTMASPRLNSMAQSAAMPPPPYNVAPPMRQPVEFSSGPMYHLSMPQPPNPTTQAQYPCPPRQGTPMPDQPLLPHDPSGRTLPPIQGMSTNQPARSLYEMAAPVATKRNGGSRHLGMPLKSGVRPELSTRPYPTQDTTTTLNNDAPIEAENGEGGGESEEEPDDFLIGSLCYTRADGKRKVVSKPIVPLVPATSTKS
jgi:hypothetical protein